MLLSGGGRRGGSRDAEPREEVSEEPSAHPLITAGPFFFMRKYHPLMLEVVFNKPLQVPRTLREAGVHAGGMEGLKD